MRQFIKRALQKFDKLTPEQVRSLLLSAAGEIDRFETALDSLNEGILVCDSGHNLILANKCALRLLPLASFEQGKDPIWTVVQDEKVMEFLEATLPRGDKAEDREFEVENKGIIRLLSLSVLPLVRDRQVSGSLIRAADITEQRSREARLRRMESLASLTTLAAGVAHEIKNPLGSLSIHVQLIQKALKANQSLLAGKAPRREETLNYLNMMGNHLEVVNEEIDRLNRIVVDFLFAVRPMNMELRAGDINALIREAAAFVGVELEAAGIRCTLDLDETLPALDFDERFIKQALLNLIKNAMAAMPRGGRLSVKTRAVEGEALISISDTGSGIPEENIPKIFEPYFTTKETGSGLGLTLVFKIVREHQGEISVKSRPGEGSCFTIALPIPQRETRLLTAGEG